MASTRSANAALTRKPASLSLSRAVPRIAAQRSFGSWARATPATAAAAGNANAHGARMGLRMGAAWKGRIPVGGVVEARRWSSGSSTNRKDAPNASSWMVGFDEVSDMVNKVTENNTPEQYLNDQTLPLLIDVRSPAEYAAGAIPAAINLPVNSHMDVLFAAPEDWEDRLGFLKPDEKRELVFYCKAGVRSHAAAQFARQAGFARVWEYPGSWLDWEEKGGQVVKGHDLLKGGDE